jgi:hypothetical protein
MAARAPHRDRLPAHAERRNSASAWPGIGIGNMSLTGWFNTTDGQRFFLKGVWDTGLVAECAVDRNLCRKKVKARLQKIIAKVNVLFEGDLTGVV